MIFDGLPPEQMTGGIHSNGAMLLRTAGATKHQDTGQHFLLIHRGAGEKERSDYPIMYVPEVLCELLANQTNRSLWLTGGMECVAGISEGQLFAVLVP